MSLRPVLVSLGFLVLLGALCVLVPTVASGSGSPGGATYDDRALARVGAWRAVRPDGLTLSRSRERGARLMTPAPAAAGGRVTVQVGPGRGTLAVRVGGVVATTVASDAHRVRLRTVSFLGSGPVELVVRRPGRRGVWVDSVSLSPAPPDPSSSGPSPSGPSSSGPTASASPAVPLPTGVVLTEVVPDPVQVLDSDGEWVELLNTADTTAQLAGCTLTTQSGSSGLLGTLDLPPGSRAVLARIRDPARNGGVAAAGTLPVSLVNADGTLSLACRGTTIDVVGWATSEPGVARQLDPAYSSAGANDDPTHWCAATALYNGRDRGTPGGVNRPCG